ncbi:MAG: phosphoribosylanthranilate isomerase [Oscillospiraceae bacterium]|nr:phosphoribosylanthranilate isomerase [Oscillospiraceae bacterium]
MKIKLCGIRRPDDIRYVNEFKPDYVGFILSEGFKRSVGLGTFCELKSHLDKNIKTVGVFVNEPLEYILKYYAEELDVIQLHGDETAEYLQELKKMVKCNIWRAVRLKNAEYIITADNMGADLLLFDSFSVKGYGGTGKTADWNIISRVNIKTPYFLAGGLNKNNICDAIKTVKPYGIDISGGIETDGFKDREKIENIMKLIRSGNFE